MYIYIAFIADVTLVVIVKRANEGDGSWRETDTFKGSNYIIMCDRRERCLKIEEKQFTALALETDSHRFVINI